MFISGNVVLILLISLFYRFWKLGVIPGANADEYWLFYHFKDILNDRSSDLLTPTGRPLAFPYAMAAYFSDLIFPGTFWTLRVPAAVSGVLTIIAAFFFLNKTHSIFAATAASVLIAVIPINIVFSRLGWEYGFIGLASLLITGFSLKGRWFFCLISMLFGMSLHPILVFLSPMCLLLASYDLWTKYTFRISVKIMATSIIITAPVIGVAVFCLTSDVMKAVVFSKLSSIMENLLSVERWGLFYENLFRMLSYDIVIDRVGFSYMDSILNGKSLSILFLTITIIACFRMYRQRNLRLLIFSGGVFLSILSLYVSTGLLTVSRPYERYGLFLIVPIIICISVFIDHLCHTRKTRQICLLLLIAGAWLSVYEFNRLYFRTFELTGGNVHPTYKTGPVEPKIAAVQWIVEDYNSGVFKNSNRERPVVFTHDWRTYWPIDYVTQQKSVKLIQMTETQWTNDIHLKSFFVFLSNNFQLFSKLMKEGAYILGFSGIPFEFWYYNMVTGMPLKRTDFLDFAGNPAISVWYCNERYNSYDSKPEK